MAKNPKQHEDAPEEDGATTDAAAPPQEPYPTGEAKPETAEEHFARLHPHEALKRQREADAAKQAEKDAKQEAKKDAAKK